MSLDALLQAALAPSTEREALWRLLLDRLIEVDGSQLQTVVTHVSRALQDATCAPIHCLVYQVVKKLGCRGEVERKLLIKEDIPKRMLVAMDAAMDDANALALGLQALYPLAFDAPHRTYLLNCGSLPVALRAMQLHSSHFATTTHGSKFLQLMAFDDDCKTMIVDASGLPIVLDALLAFASHRDLAVSASDLAYFLVADLEPGSAPIRGLEARIIAASTRIMDQHRNDDRVQSHGVAILNSLTEHADARPLLCTSEVLLAIEDALGATYDATADALVLLYELCQDATCLAKIGRCLRRRDDGRPSLLEKLETIHALVETRASEAVTLDELATTSVEVVPPPTARVAPLPKASLVLETGANEISDALLSPSTKSVVDADVRAPTLAAIAAGDDDVHGCAPKDELNSNCFPASASSAPEKRMERAPKELADEPPVKILYSRSTPSAAPPDVISSVKATSLATAEPPKPIPFQATTRDDDASWAQSPTSVLAIEQLEAQYQEAAAEAIERERTKTRKLLFNYKLLQRRLAEQHKLLCVHNERSVADSEIHEALLARVTHLETALGEAQRTCEAERSARLSHETEAMKAHGALAAALTSLEEQKTRVFKEKRVGEKQFVDAQHVAQALSAEKEVLLESLKTSHECQRGLEAQLEALAAEMAQSKRESLENLFMREEDVEVLMPSTYYVQASPMSKRSTKYALHGLASPTIDVVNEPELKDKKAIETFLFRTYKCLEACSEGHGVHFSILRRYFVDTGLVTPPLLLGDVDMTLNKILSVAQDNKLKVKQRKDYEFGACPVRPNFGKLRHRYFSRSLFCEAVTLVGAKRYPDVETPEMLRLVILHHLNPFSKSIEAKGDVQLLVSCYDAFGFLKVLLDALHGQWKTEKTPDSRPESLSHAQIVGAMLEMVPLLQREQKPLRIICEFYTSVHDVCKDEALDMGLESLVSFAVDFEIIPAFLDRLAVKRLYKEVLTYVKTFLAHYAGFPCPVDKKKYVAFYMLLMRLAVDIFKDKRDYEMPEAQVTGLLQWLDNSRGRGRIIRKGSVHAGIKFSHKLYTVKGS
ncbi:hypothetical protein SPRG_06939 [Saprolegnia parasitica CBS 223.65]|uniref:Uncharacterized protein n=1 Tax=Saprolegnia parasitica (strain CBS 223.65) TaxID=695850 RepID=A0A067CLD0_SAPPC|nr:hypothetical protein SPRG_06939 [Saprolegnia parasitica CBS 223.65]KDO27351.1 hypothetical protein SPRG_06939 [Saprolegnia parasitica CBS 223.65]|eukprot:XP_012201795.1 hypothetical protein SPRG_06939 [Saprolegnia parasitica CBS 223.65]